MPQKQQQSGHKLATNNDLSLPSPSRTGIRTTEPDYVLVLRKFGFLRPGDLRDSWGLWQLVTADHAVTAMAAKIEAKRPFHSRSAAAIYKTAKQVVRTMTPAQRAALKLRLGISQ